jgi:hypothetical protein
MRTAQQLTERQFNILAYFSIMKIADEFDNKWDFRYISFAPEAQAGISVLIIKDPDFTSGFSLHFYSVKLI